MPLSLSGDNDILPTVLQLSPLHFAPSKHWGNDFVHQFGEQAIGTTR
jgi:hypothetical protein